MPDIGLYSKVKFAHQLSKKSGLGGKSQILAHKLIAIIVVPEVWCFVSKLVYLASILYQ